MKDLNDIATVTEQIHSRAMEVRADAGRGAPLTAAERRSRVERLAPTAWWLAEAHGGAGLGLQAGARLLSELGHEDVGLAIACLPGIYLPALLSRLGSADARMVLDRAGPAGDRTVLLGGGLSGSGGVVATAHGQDGTALLRGTAWTVRDVRKDSWLLVGARGADDAVRLFSVPAGSPGVRVAGKDLGAVASAKVHEIAFANCPATSCLPVDGGADTLLFDHVAVDSFMMIAIGLGLLRRIRDLSMRHGESHVFDQRQMIFSVPFAARMGQVQMLIDAVQSTVDGAAEDFDESGGAHPASLGLVEAAVAGEQAMREVAAACAAGCGIEGRTTGSALLRATGEAEILAALSEGDLAARLSLYERRVCPELRGNLY